ncbi:MAG: hypothetical protein HQM09_20445 [Candidatus Riflebacteria bacterium]|nr:hypothetical protein [Candidatus Riflebacteria bacterium]
MNQKQTTIEGTNTLNPPTGSGKKEIPDWIRLNLDMSSLSPWQRGR